MTKQPQAFFLKLRSIIFFSLSVVMWQTSCSPCIREAGNVFAFSPPSKPQHIVPLVLSKSPFFESLTFPLLVSKTLLSWSFEKSKGSCFQGIWNLYFNLNVSLQYCDLPELKVEARFKRGVKEAKVAKVAKVASCLRWFRVRFEPGIVL